MRTFVPTLMTAKLAETFAYRSICFPNVHDGFVGEPPTPFVFEITADPAHIRER
jgi:hypothetical protein